MPKRETRLAAMQWKFEISFPFPSSHFKTKSRSIHFNAHTFRPAISSTFVWIVNKVGIFDNLVLFYCSNQKTELILDFPRCIILHFSNIFPLNDSAHIERFGKFCWFYTPAPNLILKASTSPLSTLQPLSPSFLDNFNGHSVLTANSPKFIFYTGV